MSAQSIEVDDNNAKKIMDPLKSLIQRLVDFVRHICNKRKVLNLCNKPFKMADTFGISLLFW